VPIGSGSPQKPLLYILVGDRLARFGFCQAALDLSEKVEALHGVLDRGIVGQVLDCLDDLLLQPTGTHALKIPHEASVTDASLFSPTLGFTCGARAFVLAVPRERDDLPVELGVRVLHPADIAMVAKRRRSIVGRRERGFGQLAGSRQITPARLYHRQGPG